MKMCLFFEWLVKQQNVLDVSQHYGTIITHLFIYLVTHPVEIDARFILDFENIWLYEFAKVAITKYHRLVGLNSRICFLRFLELGSPGSGCLGSRWRFGFLWGLVPCLANSHCLAASSHSLLSVSAPPWCFFMHPISCSYNTSQN